MLDTCLKCLLAVLVSGIPRRVHFTTSALQPIFCVAQLTVELLDLGVEIVFFFYVLPHFLLELDIVMGWLLTAKWKW